MFREVSSHRMEVAQIKVGLDVCHCSVSSCKVFHHLKFFFLSPCLTQSLCEASLLFGCGIETNI